MDADPVPGMDADAVPELCPTCGASAPPMPCPHCAGPKYCGEACRAAAWDRGHARACAQRFCRMLAADGGSPVFFLPEGPEALCEAVSFKQIQAEAAERLEPPSPPSPPGPPLTPTRFVAKKRQEGGYWDDVAARGVELFTGLRFACTLTPDGAGSYSVEYLVEAGGENGLLMCSEQPGGGVACYDRERTARKVGAAEAAALFVKLESFASIVRGLEPSSDPLAPVLVVRVEDGADGAPAAVLAPLEARVDRAAMDRPWWAAAIDAQTLELLGRRKALANEAFVAGDLITALAGYDYVVGAVSTACSGRAKDGSGPCAATQRLLATCLANRAACRQRAGDVESLHRAEDDCREALEGPYTAWLRHRCEASAARLYAKVQRRREEANTSLYELLHAGGAARAPAAARLPSKPLAPGLSLRVAAAGGGWPAGAADDAAACVLLVEFSTTCNGGARRLTRPEALDRVAAGARTPGVVLDLDADAVDATVPAAAYERLRRDADVVCVATAERRVAAGRRASPPKPRKGKAGEPPPQNAFCPICDLPTSGAAAAPRLRRLCDRGGHAACADCRDAWAKVLEDCGRRKQCPLCRDAPKPPAAPSPRDAAAPRSPTSPA